MRFLFCFHILFAAQQALALLPLRPFIEDVESSASQEVFSSVACAISLLCSLVVHEVILRAPEEADGKPGIDSVATLATARQAIHGARSRAATAQALGARSASVVACAGQEEALLSAEANAIRKLVAKYL
jgi:hypothetical protein